MQAKVIGATNDGRRLWSILIESWGKDTRESIKPFVSSYDRLDSRPTDNGTHKVRLIAGPKASNETQLAEFRAMRKREMILLQKSFIRGMKQLCIYVKHDSAHKALVAIVCYHKEGIVWFDVMQDYRLRFRCIIDAKTVSQKIMRYQLGLEGNVTYSVYAQEIKAALSSYIKKRKHNSQRAYIGAKANAPHDRKPKKPNQKGKPISTWIVDRDFQEKRTRLDWAVKS